MSKLLFMVIIFATHLSNAALVCAEDFRKSTPSEPNVTTDEEAGDRDLRLNDLSILCESGFLLRVGPATTSETGVWTLTEAVPATSQEKAEEALRELCQGGVTSAENLAKDKAEKTCKSLTEKTANAYRTGKLKAGCEGRCDKGKACKSAPDIEELPCTASLQKEGNGSGIASKIPNEDRYNIVCRYSARADAQGGVSFTCGGCE